jgi:hypothetical protein
MYSVAIPYTAGQQLNLCMFLTCSILASFLLANISFDIDYFASGMERVLPLALLALTS